MSKTNTGLVAYAQSKLTIPTIYMLGGFGRLLTQAQIDRRVNGLHCTHTIRNLKIIQSGLGRPCFDCCGLMKGYLWEERPGVVGYNIPAGSDQNASMMYNACPEKGPFASMLDIPGLLVFTQDLGHVGIYVGKDAAGQRQYIESTPAWNKWGVCQSNESIRKWAFWGRYSYITYIEPKIEPIITEIKIGDIVYVSGVGRSSSMGTGRSTGVYSNRRMKVIKALKNVPYKYGLSTNMSAPVGEIGSNYIIGYFQPFSVRKG